MPLPFILAGIAVASAGVGVKKGLEARNKNNRAKDIVSNTKVLINETETKVKISKGSCDKALQVLGKAKLEGMESLNRFVVIFNKIKNIEVNSANLNDLNDIYISKEELEKMKKLGDFGLEVSTGLAQGCVAGGLAAIGAYGGTMAFATASTGTVISGLNGVAATNATLAALGGGSLAAGGFGMIGGATVLGGLAAGAAIGITGFTMNSKAKANLENARSEYSRAKVVCEKAGIDIDRCNKVIKISDMYTKTTIELNIIFMSLIRRLKNIIIKSGSNFMYYNDIDKKVVAMSMVVAKAVKTIIEVSILLEDNTLNFEAEKALPFYQENVKKFGVKI